MGVWDEMFTMNPTNEIVTHEWCLNKSEYILFYSVGKNLVTLFIILKNFKKWEIVKKTLIFTQNNLDLLITITHLI